MKLPYDDELLSQEALDDWLRELGVEVEIRECGGYPARPPVFSEYRLEPPQIIVYRYPLMEDWLNLMSQHHAGYYGPWYYLHIAFRLYFHLEMNGLFEIERKWYHQLFGQLTSLEDRAYHFTKSILGTMHNPRKFDETVEKSFRPGFSSK